MGKKHYKLDMNKLSWMRMFSKMDDEGKKCPYYGLVWPHQVHDYVLEWTTQTRGGDFNVIAYATREEAG